MQTERVPIVILKSMDKIIDYAFDEECKNFEEVNDVEYVPGENGKKDAFKDSDGNNVALKDMAAGKDHIFLHLLKVRKYLSEVM